MLLLPPNDDFDAAPLPPLPSSLLLLGRLRLLAALNILPALVLMHLHHYLQHRIETQDKIENLFRRPEWWCDTTYQKPLRLVEKIIK